MKWLTDEHHHQIQPHLPCSNALLPHSRMFRPQKGHQQSAYQHTTTQEMHVTLWRVREWLLPCKSKEYYVFVCVCVLLRACGCPGAWACSRAWMHLALLIQHASRMRHILKSFVAPSSWPNFSILSHKRRDFWKNVIEYKMNVLILSTNFV